jgi:hypothetical protein
MKTMNLMSHVSMVLIVLVLIGKLVEHTPALLALFTFYFGYLMGKNIDK